MNEGTWIVVVTLDGDINAVVKQLPSTGCKVVNILTAVGCVVITADEQAIEKARGIVGVHAVTPNQRVHLV